MLPKFLHTIIYLLAGLCAAAQWDQSPLLTHVSEENGLSDNHVTCILKDKQGLVWIGTENGLNRLDGSTITIYKHNKDDSTSLADNHITLLREDDAHNLWIGTANGLSCYNNTTSTFTNFYLISNRYGGATNIVTGLAFDAGNVWIATDGGLIQMNRRTNRQTALLCGQTEPPARRMFCNRIICMAADSRGKLWLGTYESLWSYEPATRLFAKEIVPAGNDHSRALITALADDGNVLWVGTWDTGLKLFDKHTKAVTTYEHNNRGVGTITPFRQPDGRQYLLLNGTFASFDKAGKKFENLVEAPAGSLPESPVVYASEDGWIWYGTNDGVYLYIPQRQAFRTQVFHNIITTQDIMLRTAGNHLLVGAGSLHILKSYTDSFTTGTDYSQLIFGNTGVQAAEALSFVDEGQDSWWLGTSQGLVHLRPGSRQSHWYRHSGKDSTSLPLNFITCLLPAGKQKLWLFPWRQGVWQMDKTTGKCRMMLDGLNYAAGVKKKLVIADAAEDAAGNVWMADMDEGIFLYERSSGKFTQPFTSIIGAAPQTLHIRKKGGCLYSAANNLFIKWTNRSDCIAIPFPEEICKSVFDFAADKEGNWWFTTRNGLVYYNEAGNSFKRFTTADGLYTNDMAVSILCRPNGEMVIGAPGFLTRFYPDKLLASTPRVPAVMLAGFSANGAPLTIAKNYTVSLTHLQNNIVVNWALPAYTNPFKNRYYCRLQGIDSTWHYAGNKGEVQYANLAPGSYTLLLKASDANGDPSPNTLQLAIHIYPPFWKTIWFLCLYLSVAAVAIYFFVSRHIKTIRRQAAIRQQMAGLEMKALRAQMNPHFIFNSLSSIQECIVMNDTDAAYTYLGKFSKLVRSILENSGRLFITLKEEMEMLNWYVQLEQLRFREPVLFSMKADEDPETADIRLPGMIIQPYVENALWHGLIKKQGEKKLSVFFVRRGNVLECTVQDNGVGRGVAAARPKSNKKSMGMQITRERLAALNQQARVETIDLLDAMGQPAGTRIVIYLPII